MSSWKIANTSERSVEFSVKHFQNGSTQVLVNQYQRWALSQNWILVSQTDFTIQELITMTTLLPEIIDSALPLIEEKKNTPPQVELMDF